MGSFLSGSHSSSLHALIANVSSLFGIVVFLQQLWGASSLEHTLITAAVAGLATYLILALGYAAARSILRHAPSSDETEDDASAAASEASEDPSDASLEEQALEVEARDTENVAEPQAA